MIYGLTQNGFVRKPKTIIQSEIESRMKNDFGSDVDLSVQSVHGILVAQFTDDLDVIWQTLENIYYSLTVDGCEGIQLDRVVAFAGIRRLSAKSAIVDLDFTGDDGFVIPIGLLVQTPTNIQFVVTEEKIISSGVATAKARALEKGESGNRPANSITQFANPITGLDTVINPSPSVAGESEESDADLRIRFKFRTNTGGSSVDSIQGAFNNLELVNSAIVYENVSNAVDFDGLPPKSIEAVIFGTATIDSIAKIFLDLKPAGIESYGNTAISVLDNKGILRNFNYTIPTQKSIFITLNITKNSDYPTINSAEDLILKSKMKENLIKYLGGNFGSKSYKSLGSNIIIYAWQLISVQYGLAEFETEKVLGIANQIILFGTTANPTSSDPIYIGKREYCITDIANISIQVS